MQKELATIDLESLDGVTGGWGGAVRAGQAIYRGGRAVVNAFKPAKPLTNSKNTGDYAGDLAKVGTAGAGAAEGVSRAAGKGSVFFGGDQQAAPTAP